MKIIVTDAKYRMTVSLVRDLLDAGESVAVVHCDDGSTPLCFKLKGVEKVSIPADDNYIDRLLELLNSQSDEHVLLPCGGETIDLLSRNLKRLPEKCHLLLAEPSVLATLNNKIEARELAESVGARVPRQYEQADNGSSEDLSRRVDYPCVIKYVCGEKLKLPASARYCVVRSSVEFCEKYKKMSALGELIVQEYIEGVGVGASLLITRTGELADFICHSRIREYPVSGGPSTCCESIYSAQAVEMALRILKAANYCGAAMVEFKRTADGELVFLEINPRIWGSYPLARATGSKFSVNMCLASMGRGVPCDICSPNYSLGVEMRFALSDLMAMLGYFKNGNKSAASAALRDAFNPPKDGLFEKGGLAVSWAYFKSVLRRRK